MIQILYNIYQRFYEDGSLSEPYSLTKLCDYFNIDTHVLL